MNIFEIKEEYKAAVVGFNRSGLPLGKRDDLHLLAEMAEHNPSLSKYFVKLPTLEEIREWKERKWFEVPASAEATAGEKSEPLRDSGAILPVLSKEEMERGAAALEAVYGIGEKSEKGSGSEGKKKRGREITNSEGAE